MDQEPEYAFGTGGLTARPRIGTCWDHFTLLFQYPNQVGITFSSRQFEGHGSPGGIKNRMFGSEGVLETQYGGEVIIRGKEAYSGGKSPKIFTDGAVKNIAAFHEDITKGNFDNPTVAPSVRSNLVTVLGRTAAYEGRKIAWTEIVNSKKRMEADLEGLKP
jgi:hypothetical protein